MPHASSIAPDVRTLQALSGGAVLILRTELDALRGGTQLMVSLRAAGACLTPEPSGVILGMYWQAGHALQARCRRN